MKKRSQMEIMGIAIVVIIISIVIVFVVRWGVLKKPVEHKKEFAQSEIASNLVNTMLSTTTGCKGMTFSELFQDCDGGATTSDCDGTRNSCIYLHDPSNPGDGEVDKILDATLGIWKYKYEFTVGSTVGSFIAIDTCEDEQGNKIIERKARTYPIAGGIEAKLAICG